MALNVLIVDDSSAIRKILQRVLRQTDIPLGDIHEAGDGREALDMMQAKQDIGLVLSDINMPKMDGLQLLGEIRSRTEWASVPVVMITTEGGQARVMEAATLGASGYLRKPFTAEQIKTKLATLI